MAMVVTLTQLHDDDDSSSSNHPDSHGSTFRVHSIDRVVQSRVQHRHDYPHQRPPPEPPQPQSEKHETHEASIPQPPPPQQDSETEQQQPSQHEQLEQHHEAEQVRRRRRNRARQRRYQQQQQQQQQQRQDPYQPPIHQGSGPLYSPFRMYNLSVDMNHGIQPQQVLPSTSTTNNNNNPNPTGSSSSSSWAWQADRVDGPIQDHPTPDHVLTAYMEEVDLNEWAIEPLPIRQHAQATQLRSIAYTRVRSCSRLTQAWPVDDTPAETDAFLPWIHDVFPTANGQFVQFVAQNKRRCRSGTTRQRNETHILRRMQPQVALFQHVSVKRIPNSLPNDPETVQTNTTFRYRLSTHADADPDGLATRFICRFQPSGIETLSVFNFDYDWTSYRKRYKNTFAKDDGGIKSIHTSQLIFQCPIPEFLHDDIRTGQHVHNDWTSLFVDVIPIRTPPRFGTPVQYLQPRYQEFQTRNTSLLFNATHAWGTNHVLPTVENSGRWQNIPICLPSLLQYGKGSRRQQPQKSKQEEEEAEDDQVRQQSAAADAEPAPVSSDAQELPFDPQFIHSTAKTNRHKRDNDDRGPIQHRLVACIWASAGYNTRGNRFAINDGQRRLLEWISYNKVIGFDHFYLYDNSGAFASGSNDTSSSTSLKPIADLFPDDITYIPWPSQICNNRPNNVDSPGERSSQYAAEASCRLRFGPHVEWIGQFDIDEYLVPMGKHDTILSLLDQLDEEDTRILSFGSWRAWPRRAFINEIHPIEDPSVCWHNEACFDLSIPQNVTMLQAYNCDRQPPGHKTEVMPAEKQVYRTNYVTHHFIHYSAVTKLSEKNRTEYEADGFRWRFRAFPDPRQRFAKEETEGLMLHAKAVALQDTAGYQRMCSVENLKLPIRKQGTCRLGVPWPKGSWPTDFNNPPLAGTKEGYAFNCYVNAHIEELLIPRLEEELKKHSNLLTASPPATSEMEEQ